MVNQAGRASPFEVSLATELGRPGQSQSQVRPWLAARQHCNDGYRGSCWLCILKWAAHPKACRQAAEPERDSLRQQRDPGRSLGLPEARRLRASCQTLSQELSSGLTGAKGSKTPRLTRSGIALVEREDSEQTTEVCSGDPVVLQVADGQGPWWPAGTVGGTHKILETLFWNILLNI